MVAVPGGASGLLCRDYKGKENSPNCAAMSAKPPRNWQWKTRVEERKALAASPAAITLALLLTDEELDSLEKRAGDGEIARRGRPGGAGVASPPAARHGEPAPVFPASAADPDGRPGMDGVICGSRIRAVAKDRSRSFRFNAVVCSRVHELQEALSAGTIAQEITAVSRPSKSAGTGCAPDWIWSWISGQRTCRSACGAKAKDRVLKARLIE